MEAIKIPYTELSPEALHGVIEEFVTRDGTDYGEIEVCLETKISQVLGQLKAGKAEVFFDRKSETCNIIAGMT
ncbi:MAG: YheU family protein [Desulfobacteraceae bacterium]